MLIVEGLPNRSGPKSVNGLSLKEHSGWAFDGCNIMVMKTLKKSQDKSLWSTCCPVGWLNLFQEQRLKRLALSFIEM